VDLVAELRDALGNESAIEIVIEIHVRSRDQIP